ncbi:winged helix-turn-helix domain-containing protein [Rubrivirga sp.]|uniref:winged helix-turn-helix domain-containing protein n=1 Tax=Rubrivirga sp. TaxID=1885344 RepID=UPI003B516EA7
MEPVTTADQPTVTAPFRVGEWVAEPMANRLTRGDDVRKLEPKVMEVLAAMAARPGETVTKDEFMAEVWTGTVVTDDVLARCISELRKALDDEARNPTYVETLRKRGYALIAPVEHDLDLDLAAPALPPPVAVPAPMTGLDVRRPALPTRTRPGVLLWALAGVVVVLAGAFVAYQAGVAGVRPLGAAPVTSFVGDERDPALSPDGARVAFAWDGGVPGVDEGERQFDIYVLPADGVGDPVRLTMQPADELSPAWSPDGERVAFVRCGVGGECGIHAVDAGGGPEQTLVQAGDLDITDLVWSPDGQLLAFSGRRGRQGAFSLHLLPLDGSAPQRLTSPASTYPGDLGPAFSPDGRQLAFVRTALDGRQDVAVVTVQGGRVRRLAREQKGITGLDWTPDGREVVYAANRDGAAGLWRVGLDGGDPRWVALGSDGGEIAGPSVGRNGGLAFARQLVRSQVVEVAGGGAARPLLPSTRDDRQPAVAPDGSRVAFVSTRSGSHEVWTAEPDGAGARQLTTFGGARVSGPRWSPDGRRLVVSARAGGDADADVFLILPDGEARALTDVAADDVAPTWSRDGLWVYFASDRGETWQIYRVPSGGGAAEPVTVGGGVAAAEAPGGGLLVLRPDRRGLWRLPVVDGEIRDVRAERLRVNLSPADWANWAVVGDAVYVLERRYDRAATVVRLDPATGARVTLAAVDDVPEDSGLGVFPGGGRLLLSRLDRADSDVVRVEDFR